MNIVERAIGIVAEVFLLAALVGLAHTKRLSSCLAFSSYVVAAFVSEVLISFWPARFYHQDFWLLKESMLGLLKFAIAIEIALRTVRSFSGAKATARAALLVVLVVTYVVVLSVQVTPLGMAGYKALASELLPRIATGTIWLFTAVAALILWYRLPVDPLHKAILVGFVPYLLVFTVAMNALSAFGWDLREYAGYAQTIAYVVLVAYWVRAAWRQPDRAELPIELESNRGASRVPLSN
jgi:hypothetical protein